MFWKHSEIHQDTDYNMSRLSYFQSLALLEKDVDIKLAVLNVLQHFSKGSGKYIHVLAWSHFIILLSLPEIYHNSSILREEQVKNRVSAGCILLFPRTKNEISDQVEWNIRAFSSVFGSQWLFAHEFNGSSSSYTCNHLNTVGTCIRTPSLSFHLIDLKFIFMYIFIYI